MEPKLAQAFAVADGGAPRNGSVGGAARPLVVDLDGTLIRSDLLVETAFAFIGRRPLEAWRLVGWLLQGKAVLKRRLAEQVSINAATLPYSQAALTRIEAARAQGSLLYIASASDERYVAEVARHLGGIEGWFGSDGEQNLSGRTKADRLASEFGESGFDYMGNATVDMAIWSRAAGRIAVNAGAGARMALRKADADAEILVDPPRRSKLAALAKLLRPHQWVKNGLVVIPLLTAHAFGLGSILHAACAFLAFSMCASSVYILNDLVDVAADRDHPTKRWRPFAAGDVDPLQGLLLAPVLLVGAFAVALATLPLPAVGALAVYELVTCAYSFFLKRKMMIDVITLAGLYTIRVIGGAAAISVPLSEWLLAFSMFIFLSLALIKRHSEMAARLDAGLSDPANRDYRVADLPVLIALSAAAGYSAVIVCALYLSSPVVHTLYHHPRWLYLVCPLLLYWISRALMLSHRRAMDDDPVVFALKDRVSLATVGLMGLVAVAAL